MGHGIFGIGYVIRISFVLIYFGFMVICVFEVFCVYRVKLSYLGTAFALIEAPSE